jgi:tetratricopeptide (TPR) repeat protein
MRSHIRRFIARHVDEPLLALRYTQQESLALESATKAYHLRDRASEREKLRISAFYFDLTGQLEKAAQTYEVWIANYPRDDDPYNELGTIYATLGRDDQALPEYQSSLRLGARRYPQLRKPDLILSCTESVR